MERKGRLKDTEEVKLTGLGSYRGRKNVRKKELLQITTVFPVVVCLTLELQTMVEDMN